MPGEDGDHQTEAAPAGVPEGAGGGGAATAPPHPMGRRLGVLLAVAVLGAGGAWFAVSARRRAAGDAAPAAPRSIPQTSASAQPRGVVSTSLTDVALSPAARVQAEKFKCVCGCELSLAECTCTKTPGSIDMKEHLRSLVNAKLTPAEIERGMVEKYGPEALRTR